LYGTLQSTVLVVLSLITFSGSDTCISRQVRSWLDHCDAFKEYVQRIHSGNLDTDIIGYSIFIGVSSFVFSIICGAAYNTHFKLFQTFREQRKQLIEPT
ncbi:hypothetical protein PENTCL1PPCAC_14469, partial [Pristionchus entomophagus]